MTRDEVQTQIHQILIDAMDFEPSQLLSDASLQGDLGIESIDLLDIQFRIERAFKIQFGRDELFPDDLLSDRSKCISGQYVTPYGLDELKQSMPFVNWAIIKEPLKVTDLKNLYTIDTLVDFVSQKMNPNVQV